MRSTASSAVLLIAAAAILLAAPAAATRYLNQETAGTPADVAASSMDPTKTTPIADFKVIVVVKLQTASCGAVQKKVDTSISAWIKRAVHKAADPVQITEDPTDCNDDDGVTAIVTVTAGVTFLSPSGRASKGQIKRAFGPTTDLTQLAQDNPEVKNLVNWAKAKKIDVISVDVVIETA